MHPSKTGYLKSDFRIFYLTNTEARDFQSHYHDFHKLLIFESGSLSYYIEGETYQLQPWDIVLVPAGQVHRPVIHDASPFRRLIIYISPAFLEQYQTQGVDLYHCFERCARENSHVLRMEKFQESRLYPIFRELQGSAEEMRESLKKKDQAESASQALGSGEPVTVVPQTTDSIKSAIVIPHIADHNEFAHLNLYQQSLLLQFLLLITRFADGTSISFPAASGSNQQILQALTYINEHLQEDLSVDQVAASCFLNRSYLMHLFRKETGYTILSYITEKRLFAARTLIQAGTPVTEACMRSGFQSYGAFYRAYRKKFGEAPKESR